MSGKREGGRDGLDKPKKVLKHCCHKRAHVGVNMCVCVMVEKIKAMKITETRSNVFLFEFMSNLTH